MDPRLPRLREPEHMSAGPMILLGVVLPCLLATVFFGPTAECFFDRFLHTISLQMKL